MQLHTAEGARKYLTAGERDAFLKAAEQAGRETRTLGMTLAYAGCRLSEALALTADRVDLAECGCFSNLGRRGEDNRLLPRYADGLIYRY